MPMMLAHGICGCSSRVSMLILRVASPTIWRAWTRAKASISSSSKSPRWRPAVKRIMEFSASTMWRRRMRSSGFILHLCRPHDFLAEIPAQVPRCAQVHFSSSQQGRQFHLDLGHREQGWLRVGLELDQKVHVALGPAGALQHRSKHRQTADVVASTDGAQRLTVCEQRLGHGRFLTAAQLGRSYHTPVRRWGNGQNLSPAVTGAVLPDGSEALDNGTN